MLGFNGDSVTYLPDKGDTLVRLICYDVPGDVMVDSFDDADFRESFAVGARGNFYSFDFTDMESCEVAGRDGVRLSYDGQLDESSDVSQGDAVVFDAGDMSCAVMTYRNFSRESPLRKLWDERLIR